MRAVLECAGIHDILSKSLGSSNTINIVHATVAALKRLEEPRAVAARRGLPLEDVAPAACCVRARRRRVPDGTPEGDPDQVQNRWEAEPADTLRSLGLKRIGDVVSRRTAPRTVAWSAPSPPRQGRGDRT